MAAFLDANSRSSRSSGIREALLEFDRSITGADARVYVAKAPLACAKSSAVDRVWFDRVFRSAYDANDNRLHPDRGRYYHSGYVEHGSTSSEAIEPKRQDVEAAWAFICDGGTLPDGLFAHSYIDYFVRRVMCEFRPLHAFRFLRAAGGPLRAETMVELVRDRPGRAKPTPLELQLAAEKAGYDRHLVMSMMPENLHWRASEIIEWVAAVLPEIKDAIANDSGNVRDSSDKYYRAVAHLPELPAVLRQLLLQKAISGPLLTRPAARRALASDPVLTSSLGDYLGSRCRPERVEAARWLGDLVGEEPAALLRSAVVTEQYDHARATMLAALERLGTPFGNPVGRQALLRVATRGIEGRMPRAVVWIRFDELPSVRWADGADVDPKILRWLVIQAVRFRSPSPTPEVQRWSKQVDAADSARFASHLLQIWLVRDDNKSPNQLLDSAVPSSGLLSLVAAIGCGEILPVVHKYIKRWRGARLNQCQRLLEMMSWIDDPTATQILASVARGFGSSDLELWSLKLLDERAHRQGLSRHSLVQRDVPRGEESSEQFGVVVKEQTLLLHDRMCVLESYEARSFGEWVVRHPVMSGLAARLVWVSTGSAAGDQLFRPTSDGTFVSSDGERISLDSATEIRLAHGAVDSPNEAFARTLHFDRLGLKAVFPQLQRPPLPLDRLGETRLVECDGMVLNAGVLKEIATELGFEMGPHEHVGSMGGIVRRVHSAGLTVWIKVYGLHVTLNENNVGLESISFCRFGGVQPVTLGEVPPVLLAESLADLNQIVELCERMGPGWERQVGW